MLLAIDVGNTNTVFAIYRGKNMTHTWRCKTESSRSADEYAVFLNQLFDLEDIEWKYIEDVIISSVVPDTNFHLTKFCEKYTKAKTLFVDSQSTDIIVDLDQPNEIGADRLVNASAVIAHYPLPAIVVDFGTATTFDIIDDGHVYRGGVIAPGVRLSVEALAQKAAKLPNVAISKPRKAIGKNTQSAMRSGMYWGYIGMVEKIIDSIKEELGTKPHVIATGGLAPLYSESTDYIDTVDEHLIFKGLYEIYKKQK